LGVVISWNEGSFATVPSILVLLTSPGENWRHHLSWHRRELCHPLQSHRPGAPRRPRSPP